MVIPSLARLIGIKTDPDVDPGVPTQRTDGWSRAFVGADDGLIDYGVAKPASTNSYCGLQVRRDERCQTIGTQITKRQYIARQTEQYQHWRVLPPLRQ
jgi:hypothetical protein